MNKLKYLRMEGISFLLHIIRVRQFASIIIVIRGIVVDIVKIISILLIELVGVTVIHVVLVEEIVLRK